MVALAHSDRTSAEDIAALTFKEIGCRFGLPLTLTKDNDVRFVGAVWRALWKLCGTKLKFSSSFNPQSDQAERANRQVLEGLRVAVATVSMMSGISPSHILHLVSTVVSVQLQG